MPTPEDPGAEDGVHLDPFQWHRLLESVGLDSLLVVIQRLMGEDLRRHFQPEDLLQEALALAWRDRATHTWSGVHAFRAWLIGIARHRVMDAADRIHAEKRPRIVEPDRDSGKVDDSGVREPMDRFPAHSPTPGHMASSRERAALMSRALESLSQEHEPVVRLHLFEQLPMKEVAERVGAPEATCWSRFKRGSQLFAQALKQLLRESGSSS